jgi:hypothetical protein
LSGEQKSPDGFQISRGSRFSGLFPFLLWNSQENDRFIKGGNVSRKVLLPYSNHPSSFEFVGWVAPDA